MSTPVPMPPFTSSVITGSIVPVPEMLPSMVSAPGIARAALTIPPFCSAMLPLAVPRPTSEAPPPMAIAPSTPEVVPIST